MPRLGVQSFLKQKLNMYETIQINNPMLAALWAEADNIQALLLRPMNIQDPNALTYHFAELDAQMARLSEMLIRANAYRDKTRHDYETDNEDKLTKLTATVANRMIKNAIFEHTLVCDRLQAMYDEGQMQRRDIITQISWIKEQMKQFSH